MVGPRREGECEEQAAGQDRLDDHQPSQVKSSGLEGKAEGDGDQASQPERPSDQLQQDGGVKRGVGPEFGCDPLLDHIGDREGAGGCHGESNRDWLHARGAHAPAKLNAMSDIMTFGRPRCYLSGLSYVEMSGYGTVQWLRRAANSR